MSSRILAILGFSSSKPTQDAQPAQQVGCAPPPATHAACHATNIVDAYLNNATPPYRPSSQLSTAPPPPPYAPYGHDIVEVQPGIYKAQEPRTLARMLFYYGFRELFYFRPWVWRPDTAFASLFPILARWDVACCLAHAANGGLGSWQNG